jgi:hypothetical protein
MKQLLSRLVPVALIVAGGVIAAASPASAASGYFNAGQAVDDASASSPYAQHERLPLVPVRIC